MRIRGRLVGRGFRAWRQRAGDDLMSATRAINVMVRHASTKAAYDKHVKTVFMASPRSPGIRYLHHHRFLSLGM